MVALKNIDELRPFKTVLLYRDTDLYPVVGFKYSKDLFLMEEGGPEDGDHRKYPPLAYKPTHWAPLPEPWEY